MNHNLCVDFKYSYVMIFGRREIYRVRRQGIEDVNKNEVA